MIGDRGRPALGAAVIDVVLLMLGALAAAWVVWRGGIWLTNDGPQHLFSSYVPLHIDDEARQFGRYLVANVPPTSLGFRAVFTLFEPLVGWETAYRLTHVVAVELWALAFIALVRAFSPERTIVGLLGFPTAFQLSLYIGLIPFLIGSALALCALAAWRSLPGLLVRTVITALLLYLAARSHVVAAVIGGAALVPLALTDARESPRARVLFLLACGTAPVIVLVQMQLAALDAALEPADDGEPVFWTLADRLFRMFQPGPAWRGALTLGFMAVGFVCALRGALAEKVLALVGLLLVCTSIAAPRDFLGWQLAGVRFLPIGAAGLLALIAVERLSPAWRRAVRVGIVAFSAVSLGWALQKSADLRARSERVLRPLASLSPRPRLLAPAILDECIGPCDPEMPEVINGWSVVQCYTLVLGGEAALVHAGSPAVHHILERELVDQERIAPPAQGYWRARPERRLEVARQLAIWLSVQEAVFVVGSPEEIAAFREAGYRAEVDDGLVFLGTFEGCRGSILVEGAAGRTARVGAWPMKTAAVTVTLDANGAADADAVPCGEVWLDVEGVRCEGQEPGLPLRARWTHGANNTLRCSALATP